MVTELHRIMDRMLEQAAQWNIETEHYDGLGRYWRVDPEVLRHILDAVGANGRPRPHPTAETLLSCDSNRAFQGNDTLPQRSWGIAVQLYGIRSRHNWGHGDFADLADL